MKNHLLGIAILGAFIAFVMGSAFAVNYHHPLGVLAGEDSVGTWVSGVLLVVSATICLQLGFRRSTWFWFLISVFFLTLALDERFMFHEEIKQRIIFANGVSMPPVWIIELPVIVGACIGGLVSWSLWRKFHYQSRKLLVVATASGLISVAVDITTAGVLWEELAKLIGEFLFVASLILHEEEVRS